MKIKFNDECVEYDIDSVTYIKCSERILNRIKEYEDVHSFILNLIPDCSIYDTESSNTY